jgi:spore germination cell wall hydrolase CwlJ-like protein
MQRFTTPATGASTAVEIVSMTCKYHWTSHVTVAVSALITLYAAGGSGAFAQQTAQPSPVQPAIQSQGTGQVSNQADPGFSTLETQPLANPTPQADGDATESTDSAPASSPDGQASNSQSGTATKSLAALVAVQPLSAEALPEIKCLAAAIYFEARSESLAGQLAVGRVIVNRSHSGRFPGSYCGVVYQRSQFSFIRGSSMPGINHESRLWHNAVAIAQIADANAWKSEAEGALYFHAARVSPSWGRQRVAQIEHHVFYR